MLITNDLTQIEQFMKSNGFKRVTCVYRPSYNKWVIRGEK